MREMGFQFNSVIIVLGLLFSGIFSIILGVYIYVKSNRGAVAMWFLFGQSLLGVWTVFHLFELFAPSLSLRWIIVVIVYFPICFFSTGFYMFARAYGGKQRLSKLKLLGTFTVPSLIYISVLTNPMHNLFYKAFYIDGEVYGPICYMLFAMTCIYIILGIIEFTRFEGNPSIYRKQQIYYFAAAVVGPPIVHFLSVIRFINPGFNIALIVMPFSLTLITISVLKYQFLDILPMTLAEVVETLDDGFLVVNTNEDIEDYNAIFFEPYININQCKTFKQFIDEFSLVVKNKAIIENLKYSLNVKKENYVSGEITLEGTSEKKITRYTTKAINDIHGVKIATIITFHDITEIQTLYKEYEQKKVELIKAKRKLEEHILAVSMLTVENERNRLMSEVHDTLGHSMAELLAMLEKCDIVLSKKEVDEIAAIAEIDATLTTARESLAKIRASVSKFRKPGVIK